MKYLKYLILFFMVTSVLSANKVEVEVFYKGPNVPANYVKEYEKEAFVLHKDIEGLIGLVDLGNAAENEAKLQHNIVYTAEDETVGPLLLNFIRPIDGNNPRPCRVHRATNESGVIPVKKGGLTLTKVVLELTFHEVKIPHSTFYTGVAHPYYE